MEGPESLEAGRDRWLAALRERLLQLAMRRVGADEAEDVVQSALRIIAERGIDTETASVDGLPPVAWCFQVLRNTIGNHYKRQRVRRRHMEDAEDLEVLAARSGQHVAAVSERLRILERTIEELDEPCGSLLRRSIDGMTPQEIARERGLAANAVYQRLYRCRGRLRAMLRERGILL